MVGSEGLGVAMLVHAILLERNGVLALVILTRAQTVDSRKVLVADDLGLAGDHLLLGPLPKQQNGR